MGLAGTPTVEFAKAIRKERKGLPLYALSVMGADATGIAVSQVMALPTNNVLPLVREFHDVSFTDLSKSASRFVELNMVARDGRFVR